MKKERVALEFHGETCSRQSECQYGCDEKLLAQFSRNGFHLRQDRGYLSAWHIDSVHMGKTIADHGLHLTP